MQVHLYPRSVLLCFLLLAAWQWTVNQPVGCAQFFDPSGKVANPTFTPQVSGLYSFTLAVWDAYGAKCPVPWTQTVTVKEAVP